MILLAPALACAPGDQPAPEDCTDGTTETLVVRELTFARASDGISDGFDLDGLDTPGDGGGCDVVDYNDAKGNYGIDNAFAGILPVLETTEAQAVESLIQEAILSGELLLLLELGGLARDDLDTCVDVGLIRGAGKPMIGTDGTLLSGQTFERDPNVPETWASEAALIDGVIEAHGLAFSFPITIFGQSFSFELEAGALRLERTDQGWRGLLAGGADAAYILEVARSENVDPEVVSVLALLLDTWSDLDPDGDGICERLSITFSFEAAPAFFYPE